MVVCTNRTSPDPWASLAPSGLAISFSLCPLNEIPQDEPSEANTFPTKPRRPKAREFPADASVSLPGRGPCLWHLSGARTEGAGGHLPSPAAWCTAQGICVSLLPGEGREKKCCCACPTLLPCLPKAPSPESGLARLPFVPGSMPPGAHAAF